MKYLGKSDLLCLYNDAISLYTHRWPDNKRGVQFPQFLSLLQEAYLVKVMELQGAANF